MTSVLKIKNIKKTYFQKGHPPHEALKGVNLDVKEGEIFGLLGVNGAGKTTLSSIIATLHPPTEGDVEWKGKSIYSDLYSYRDVLGFCPQVPNIDQALSIEENLLFAGRYFSISEEILRKRVKELLESFHLEKYARKKAEVLSGGYKQRFVIARTLIHKPELVILDEPTVGLDPHVRRHLWDTIRELKKEKISLILTTHYLDEAEALCDRVCIIDQGQVLKIDTPANLMKARNHTNLENVFIDLINQEREENEEV